MKSQNNSTAFQIVAVVALFAHTIYNLIMGSFGLADLLLLVGSFLLIAGILLANTKLLTIGALLHIGKHLFSWLPHIRYYLHNVSILHLVWICLWPFVMWMLFIIAIRKNNKALMLCGIAASGDILGYFILMITGNGYLGVYVIFDVLLCIAIALFGYALQNGIQSVFEFRPVETPKTVSNQYENLIKLKDLLDSGAITQEEFDQKKKELLEV